MLKQKDLNNFIRNNFFRYNKKQLCLPKIIPAATDAKINARNVFFFKHPVILLSFAVLVLLDTIVNVDSALFPSMISTKEVQRQENNLLAPN